MRRKLMKIILLSCMVMILPACSVEDSAVSNEETKEKKIEDQSKEDNTANELDETESKAEGIDEQTIEDYVIVTETFIQGDVKVEYPQITNFHDADKESELNELIKEEALKPYQETMDNLESGQTYEAEGNYEVKFRNEEMLSIAYTSYNNIIPSAHPYHMFFTTNINLATGELLYISDFVKEVDEDFTHLLKKARYVGELKSEYVEQVREMAFSSYNSDDDLIMALLNSDEIYVYVTEDALGISMPIPHVGGDHVEFEISFSDLKEAGLVE